MARAKCGHCNGTTFALEEIQVGVAKNAGTGQVHEIGWTAFKCAGCGAVMGVTEGGILRIAERQGFKR